MSANTISNGMQFLGEHMAEHLMVGAYQIKPFNATADLDSARQNSLVRATADYGGPQRPYGQRWSDWRYDRQGSYDFSVRPYPAPIAGNGLEDY